MTSVRFDKKKNRLRKTILRGVYAENLRITGKQGKDIEGRKVIFALKKGILLFLTVAFVILGNLDYLDLSIVREDQIKLADSNVSASRDEERPVSAADSDFNLSAYSAFLTESPIPLAEIFGLTVKTIIIDPGHGGEDPGATGKMGTREKDITLDIAKRLKERLKKYKNYQVLMTRVDDVTVPLARRTEFANSLKVDLFISIHVNYLPNKPINIIETYYFGPYTDDVTIRLAEQENKGSRYSLGDFKEMLQKIGNKMKLQESKMLAMSIQQSLFKNIKRRNGNVLDFGIKTAPFVVLLGVDVPSVLTEVSCLSNREEEENLKTEDYREEIAGFLEEGIVNYLNKNKHKGDIKHEAKRVQEG